MVKFIRVSNFIACPFLFLNQKITMLKFLCNDKKLNLFYIFKDSLLIKLLYMKKNYFLTLLLTLCISSFGIAQDLIITGAFDGPNSGGTPKGVELYVVNNIADLSVYGIGSANNGGGTDGVEFTFPAVAVTAGTYLYVASEEVQFTAFFGFAPTYNAGSAMGINGDDAVELFKNDVAVDVFGDINTDGTGEAWDHVDGWAYRKDGATATTNFNSSDWTYSGINKLEGGSTNAATTSPFPLGTYSPTASTSPTLKIDSPSEGSTIDYTATATVKFTVSNFNVAAASAGDGFIKWKLDDVAQADKTDTSDITFAATAGTTYKVYIELVDNSGNALSTPVNQTVNFTVNHPCDLVLGTISTTCDALTSGTDTFNGSIAFTGGNTGVTYTITAPAGVVVGGDNPNTTASGTITFTNITEGVDAAINIAGGANSSCDFDRTLYSPTCVAFPVVDMFNYTDGSNLTDAANWQTSSGSSDKVLVATGTIGNPFSSAQFPDPTGNMVTFDGGGADPYIEFYQQNSGTVYASFLFTATDVSGLTNSNGGYFAVLTQASGSYKPRLWLRQDTGDNTKYNVGITAGSSGATYHTVMHTPGEEVFVVMAYDFATNDVKVWINPDPATFEGTPSTETLKVTASGFDIPTDLGRFLLRQDSGTETPSINFDELRISTSWADVTPKGAAASVEKNNIEGFTTYPNPVNNGRLTITTSSASEKEVTIFNVLGKRVFSQKFTGTNKQLDVSQIKSGIYIMKVIEDEKVATKKLVIK